jgi:peptidyl-prolyl cis-trans isomerase SurA
VKRTRIVDFLKPPCSDGNAKQAANKAGFLLMAALLCLLLPVPPGSTEVLDRVVATVNDGTITLSDLEEAVELFEHQMKQANQQPVSTQDRSALQRRVLEDLIDKNLIEGFAKKTGIEVTEDEVDRAIQEVLARAHITEDELREALKEDGLRYDEYRAQIRDQIMKAKMVQHEIRARVNITDVQIEGYYLDHPEEFRAEEGVVLLHILFPLPNPPSPEEVLAALEEAGRVREEILQGTPFQEAARKYSKDATAAQGGWLGFFRKGTLSPEMETGIKGLQEGEVSEPVRTALGVHLLMIQERTSGDIRPLERVQESIREKLFEEAAERQFEDWRKELRKNAHIEVFL